MVTSRVIGYDRNHNKEIIINENEALVVRMIFDLYIQGYSQQRIADHLNSNGYKTKAGNIDYYEGAIAGILNNEKYTGNALLQKTINKGVGSKISIRRQDKLPKYYVENSHPGIITQKEFDLAQSIKNKKILKYNKTLNKKELTFIAKTRTKYSKVLKCGQCGKYYQYKVNNKGTKYERKQLICASNRNKKVCSNDAIFTEIFDEVLLSITSHILRNKKAFLNSLSKELGSHPEVNNLNTGISETQERIKQTESKLNNLMNADSDFDIALKEELLKSYEKLETELITSKNKLLTSHNIEAILIEFRKILKSEDKNALNQLFSEIKIYNRNKIDFIIDPFKTSIKENHIVQLQVKTDYKLRYKTPTNIARVIIK